MLDYDLKPIEGTAPKACTRKATLHLRHSEDRTPVMMSKNALGKPLYLCAGCCALVRACAWMRRNGIAPTSQTQVGTLARVMQSPHGYEPPKFAHDAMNSGNVWHFLRAWQKMGLVMRKERAGVAVYALKDACPDCMGRGVHSEDCALS